ncbi:Filamin-A-like protein, partial [Dinothrombium tinctorium]
MSKKEIDPKRVTASGNGVDQGITGQMCMFQVINMANEVDNISTSINGPSQPTMMKGIDENGNAIVKYTPNLPGEYTVTVQYKGKHIKGSPFKVQILGESDPKLEMIKKIEVTG